MNKILLTGASSGIGCAIGRKLLHNNKEAEVYGIGRNFTRCPDLLEETKRFHPLKLDLSETETLSEMIPSLVPVNEIDTLILCAGTAWYGLLDQISPEQISEMVKVNLEAPMILTRIFLPHLQQIAGRILFISSVTAESPSPHAAVYGATKAALTHFADSLFAEYRKSGLRVTVVEPDLTSTELYRHADFMPDSSCLTSLDPALIADAVTEILSLPEGTVASRLILRPQKNRIRRK